MTVSRRLFCPSDFIVSSQNAIVMQLVTESAREGPSLWKLLSLSEAPLAIFLLRGTLVFVPT